MRALEEPVSFPPAQPWPIVVINLDRATDRMDEATRNLQKNGLSFTRFPAVCGRTLDAGLVAELTAPQPGCAFKRPLTPAEVGCFASHLLIWHKIAQGGHDRVIVLEDDARLFDGAIPNLATLARAPADWDLLKLCYAWRGPVPTGTPSIAQPSRIPYGTTGYALTREAAARLVASVVPFSRPVDIEIKTWWEHGLSVKVAHPPIGDSAHDHALTSAIDPGRRQARGGAPIGRFLLNARYQAVRQMDRLRRAGASHGPGPAPCPLHPAMLRLISERG